MKVVIVGCGRVGAELARDLFAEGHEVTVVDPDPHAIYRLNLDSNIHFVAGNGMDEDVLKRAGIDSADVLTAVTDKDNSNIMVAQIAQRLYQVPKVIARVNDPANTETFQRLGVDTACLTSLCASYLKQVVL